MVRDVELPLPDQPKLRPVEPAWVSYEGEPRLWLRDPLRLTEQAALVPGPLVPLLAALDGTRDLDSLRLTYAEQTGVLLPRAALITVLVALDGALLLDSPRLRRAKQRAVAAFRSQPARPPALAAASYPAATEELEALLASFGERAAAGAAKLAAPLLPRLTLPPIVPLKPIERAAGVLSPHIDFARGGPVYAATWRAAAPAVASAEVVIIFGTDHHGSAGRLTTTLQRYATPWGALPSDEGAIRSISDALGDDLAFDEELHHVREHSIELAAVWLHRTLVQAGVTALPAVIPILCGSFHCFTRPAVHGLDGATARPRPEDDSRTSAALEALVRAVRDRRTLVVSAADLAHVGPAFGDAAPLFAPEKVDLACADQELLATAGNGAADAFLDRLRAEADRRRVCGLPPTYWALRVLERLTGGVRGHLAGYNVCAADPQGGSVVSIAGMVWQ